MEKVQKMTELTCEDFEEMSIVELVEFIEEKKHDIVKYKEELVKYFKQKKVESLVPYYFFDLYAHVKEDYDMIRDYMDNIEEDYYRIRNYIDNIKPKALSMPDEFYELHWIDKKRVERTNRLEEIKDAFYDIFRFEGSMLFLEELLEKGYFESGKAQVLLERLIDVAHNYRYSKNDDIMSALAVFMKDKEESIQMMITELIVEYVEKSECMTSILFYIYKDGLNYTKRGVMHVFVTIGWKMISGTDDFYGAKEVLDVVADDMEGEDRYLRNQIIEFIELFELVQDEISQYLLEEKSIIYTEDMKYEAFYDKVVDMAEVLKEKIDEEKEKDKKTEQ
ncbi:MAG: hypothetical protein HGN29_12660 [Asgard group archaeon]|nr:hypothetical protein [Asgard group archaeon]